MQRQFTYKHATITIHRQRNADLLDAELLIGIFMDGADPDNRRAWQRRWHKAAKYADMLVSIDTVNGDPGLPIPSIDAPEDELRAGMEAWLTEDGLYLAWVRAHIAVNAPVGDVDTSPVADPKGTADPT
jgi:hypothetical protein